MDRDELKGIIRDILSANLGEGARAPEPGGPRAEVLDLVTEKHVMAARTDSKVVYVAPDALVTPLARETADRYGVPIETVSSVPVAPPAAGAPHAAPATARGTGPIALGADHAGLALKETLKRFLQEEAGFSVVDHGTESAEAVDYPDYAHRVASAVGRGEAWMGIIVDGVGVGSAMAANRHRGVRAAALSGIIEVINAREHNNANVLCLGGRMIGDLLARALVVTFLNTAFAGGRHARRVQKIEVS